MKLPTLPLSHILLLLNLTLTPFIMHSASGISVSIDPFKFKIPNFVYPITKYAFAKEGKVEIHVEVDSFVDNVRYRRHELYHLLCHESRLNAFLYNLALVSSAPQASTEDAKTTVSTSSSSNSSTSSSPSSASSSNDLLNVTSGTPVHYSFTSSPFDNSLLRSIWLEDDDPEVLEDDAEKEIKNNQTAKTTTLMQPGFQMCMELNVPDSKSNNTFRINKIKHEYQFNDVCEYVDLFWNGDSRDDDPLPWKDDEKNAEIFMRRKTKWHVDHSGSYVLMMLHCVNLDHSGLNGTEEDKLISIGEGQFRIAGRYNSTLLNHYIPSVLFNYDDSPLNGTALTHLPMGVIPLLEVYPVFSIMWSVVITWWLANWIKYRQYRFTMHWILTAIPISRLAWCIFNILYWRDLSSHGVLRPVSEIIKSFFLAATTVSITASLVLISKGYGIVRTKLENVEIRSILGCIMFVVISEVFYALLWGSALTAILLFYIVFVVYSLYNLELIQIGIKEYIQSLEPISSSVSSSHTLTPSDSISFTQSESSFHSDYLNGVDSYIASGRYLTIGLKRTFRFKLKKLENCWYAVAVTGGGLLLVNFDSVIPNI
ncbi:hypothetical protein BKA69DRAFT_1168434 [Paraphysoderma sedebokerense]|nr:hypothetical protein BKA69DRAFT_1168434 [Paraphysoderma sedebokerense]